MINKLRALNAWYTKGFDGGSRLRTAINQTSSIADLRALITRFFLDGDVASFPDDDTVVSDFSRTA